MNYKEDLEKAVETISSDGIILYPTDTIWGIGCDATNENSVSKIYQIKQREYSKSLIVLASDIEMLKEYVSEVPEKIIELLAQEQNPITIIYPNARKLAPNAIANDGTIAVRIPKDDFCVSLIKKFGKPIISTSANISGEIAPKNFLSISELLKIKVDYIVNHKQSDESNSKASKIVKIENNELIYIRK